MLKQIIPAETSDGRLEILAVAMDDAFWLTAQASPGSPNWVA